MSPQTTDNHPPVIAWFPCIAPTDAELAEIEVNDLPALENDCRDWCRFVAEVLATYQAELRIATADLDPSGVAA